MSTVNFVIDETAMELLTSIAKNIKTDVEKFFRLLKERGDYDRFRNLTPFAQRIEFFSESTNYKVYRNTLRQWILYGEFSSWGGGDYSLPCYHETMNLIEANAAKRAGQVYNLRWESAFGSTVWEESNVKQLMEIRRILLEENPILSDANIAIADRHHLMELALRGNKTYQYYQKQFDNMVKKAVSSLITLILLDEKDRRYANEYKKVIEGL